MLFNSYPFLFGFLPLVLLIYQVVSRFGRKPTIIWLGIASLLFYTYWKPGFLLVLVPSILWNYLFSCLISRTLKNNISTHVLLWTAIIGDLGVLCWFKYLFPTLNFFSFHFHVGHQLSALILPLGISFFTFTQLGYLIDLQQGVAEQQDFWSYLLFVTFFPHLIAGPILHHKDIMPQFQINRAYGLRLNDLAIGLSWFTMGMFKKVMIADHLSPWAEVVFSAHGLIRQTTAWIGLLAYTLQLYFDFSGYCDMALGLARMFSIDFPLNFASPYKSASIVEFWQRWHMTLSKYIGDYLYSPIQFAVSRHRQSHGKKVSRKAQATLEGYLQMVAFPTILTMFFAGVWHGAGLQFMIFGLLHGTYLSVNHGWRNWRHQRGIKALEGLARYPVRGLCVVGTFLCWAISLLFFRASNIHEALSLLKRMNGIQASTMGPFVELHNPHQKLVVLFALLCVVWILPNTQQILARYKPALELAPADQNPRLLPIFWEPNFGWSVALSSALIVAIIEMQNPSTFLYFQF